jgi:3-deoxy-7-phosphoheptulonate synthase
MLESHLVEGRQDHDNGTPLTYGQSITDACISWDTTVPLLEELAVACDKRRHATVTWEGVRSVRTLR